MIELEAIVNQARSQAEPGNEATRGAREKSDELARSPLLMQIKTSLVVSCVGAYHDSGLGTGGLVCVQNEESRIIDRLDCTGLWLYRSVVYRYVRSLKALVGYDRDGVRYLVRLGDASDVHDIRIDKSGILCVSTGTSEIHFYDFRGELTDRWTAGGRGDAWHLNCVAKWGDQWYCSAFGQFPNHRDWKTLGCMEKGFIMNLGTREVLIDKLSGPHHPMFLGDRLLVCESHRNVLLVKERDWQRRIELNGFTRGIAYDDKFLYVGESADRHGSSAQSQATIAVLDKEDYSLVKRVSIPFPEIYDILVVPDSLGEAIYRKKDEFVINFDKPVVNALEGQIDRLSGELSAWKQQTGTTAKLAKLLGKRVIRGLQKRTGRLRK